MVGKPARLWRKLVQLLRLRQVPKIFFMPDATTFSTTDFKYNTISERLQWVSLSLKNVTLSLTDNEQMKQSSSIMRTGYKFVSSAEDKKSLDASPYFEGKRQWFPSGSFTFSTMMDSQITFYPLSNNVRTKDGGTHETVQVSHYQGYEDDYICVRLDFSREKIKILKVQIIARDCISSFYS